MDAAPQTPATVPQDAHGATRRRMLAGSALAMAGGLGAGMLGRPAVAAAAGGQGVYEVKDHGAVGDGSADDTAAIQSALDACASAGGGTVHVPRGVYKLSDVLLVGSKTVVQGDGAASVLKQTAAHDVLLNRHWSDGAGDSDITVRDLRTDGNGIAPMGVVFAGVERGTVDNVTVTDCTHYGIWVWASGELNGSQGTPSRQITVTSCHVTGVIDVGIELDAAIATTVVGNTIQVQSGLAAITVWNGSTDATIIGNVVEGAGTNPPVTAFYVSSLDSTGYPRQTQRITFSGNVARNVQRGLMVTWSQPVLSNMATDIVFTGNSVHSWADTSAAGGQGVYLGHCRRVLVTNNHIDSFGVPFNIAPGSAVGTVQAVTIDGNQIDGGGTSYLYNVASGSVSNNTFCNLNNSALSFQGSSGLTISGNRAIDCGAGKQVALATFYDYNSTSSDGNVFIGNHTVDSRSPRYTAWVGILNGAADFNILMGNSAKGALSKGSACPNNGSGKNNVIVNNVNG